MFILQLFLRSERKPRTFSTGLAFTLQFFPYTFLLPFPARSWYIDKRGAIVLSISTFDTTINNSNNSLQTSLDCQVN